MRIKEQLKVGIREELAAIEHEQWAHWTKYMLQNLTDANIARWKSRIETPYSELSESERESDREWADRVIDLFDDYLHRRNVLSYLVED